MNETNFNTEEFATKMPGGFFVYHADDKEEILYANDILLEIFGCKTLDEFKELTGYTFKGLVYPEDFEEVQKNIKNQIAENDKKLDYVEFRITRKDGVVRWVDDYGRLVHTEKYGDVYFVFIRDITHQRKARAESVRRAKVIEGLSIGFNSIYLLNLNTKTMRPYRLQNSYFNEIVKSLNISDNEEQDWMIIFSEYAKRYVIEEDRNLYLKEISQGRIIERLQTEDSYKFSFRCKGVGSNIINIEVSVVAIKDDSNYQQVVMGYSDVTEQILRLQKDLAEKLNMEIALEREKHSNEVKASFLFSMSHDIRTPMNAIMGFTALAKRHINEPELLSDYLEKLDESNRHMLALIDDLLEMSKIDYGKIEIKTEACDLNKQLDIVFDMFKAQIEEKNLSFVEEINLPPQEVLIDVVRFRRIMTNLISNAIKFTHKGGIIKVKARQKRVSQSGYARYEFSIEDNGIGMSEEFLQRVFSAFEREETSTQTGYIGTGLGLSITKKLLDIMGGSISVKSKKGEGSKFTVDLPLKLVQSEELPQDTKSVDNESKQDFKAAGKYRILLVEDIEVNRMLAETILTESGFLVESVPDGCDAVDAIKNHSKNYYDLVLMDIQMPVMNGYEATRAIRALGREDTVTLPIIALSANAREQDKKMSLESGMDSHVAKPFDIAHLISTINEHINKIN